MSVKGFSSSKKTLQAIPGYTSQEAETTANFVTVQDAASDHQALDIAQRAPYSVSTGNVVTAATKRVVNATAVAGKKFNSLHVRSKQREGLSYPNCPRR
jgi:hypothetical protein